MLVLAALLPHLLCPNYFCLTKKGQSFQLSVFSEILYIDIVTAPLTGRSAVSAWLICWGVSGWRLKCYLAFIQCVQCIWAPLKSATPLFPKLCMISLLHQISFPSNFVSATGLLYDLAEVTPSLSMMQFSFHPPPLHQFRLGSHRLLYKTCFTVFSCDYDLVLTLSEHREYQNNVGNIRLWALMAGFNPAAKEGVWVCFSFASAVKLSACCFWLIRVDFKSRNYKVGCRLLKSFWLHILKVLQTLQKYPKQRYVQPLPVRHAGTLPGSQPIGIN